VADAEQVIRVVAAHSHLASSPRDGTITPMGRNSSSPSPVVRHAPGREWLTWGLLGMAATLLLLGIIPALGGEPGWQSLGSLLVAMGFAVVGALRLRFERATRFELATLTLAKFPM
jgi:hypothetical protein